MKKVSKTKIAFTYATALYEAAEETRAVEAVFKDVLKLKDALAEEPETVKYLANPLWDDDAKKAALGEIAKRLQWNSDTLRCLDIIADNRRFKELPLILQEFVHLYYQKRNIEEVEVESIKKLSASQDKKLRDNLKKLLEKEVVIAYRQEPNLIGGLRIKFGSQMIDNSLISKLNRLENTMKGEQ